MKMLGVLRFGRDDLKQKKSEKASFLEEAALSRFGHIVM